MSETVHAQPTESLKLDDPESMESILRAKIVHILKIYPKIGPSMLQVGLGTGLMPSLWHPVLNRMIEDGIIEKTQLTTSNPGSGRSQVYTIYSLANA